MEGTDGSVCFDARIEFQSEQHFKQLETEIHLLSFAETGLYFLCLLHPDVERLDIPTELSYEEYNFDYEKEEGLLILGRDLKDKSFLLHIYPISPKCNPQTMEELRRKILN